MAADTKEAPDLVAELVATPAAIAPAGTTPLAAVDVHAERLKSIEDDLLEESLRIVRDTMKFRDIDADGAEIPAEWADLPPEEQVKRLRIAKAAWQNAKNAPVGLTIARQTVTGILKARSTEQQQPRQLNIAVQFNMPATVYPRKRLEPT